MRVVLEFGAPQPAERSRQRRLSSPALAHPRHVALAFACARDEGRREVRSDGEDAG